MNQVHNDLNSTCPTVAITNRMSAPDINIANLSFNGEIYSLELGNTTIGRSRKNDVHLDDDSVSAFHSNVEVRNSGIFITDLHSTNSTFIDNNKILPRTRYRLTHGSVLKFGNVEGMIEIFGYDIIIRSDSLISNFSLSMQTERIRESVSFEVGLNLSSDIEVVHERSGINVVEEVLVNAGIDKDDGNDHITDVARPSDNGVKNDDDGGGKDEKNYGNNNDTDGPQNGGNDDSNYHHDENKDNDSTDIIDLSDISDNGVDDDVGTEAHENDNNNTGIIGIDNISDNSVDDGTEADENDNNDNEDNDNNGNDVVGPQGNESDNHNDDYDDNSGTKGDKDNNNTYIIGFGYTSDNGVDDDNTEADENDNNDKDNDSDVDDLQDDDNNSGDDDDNDNSGDGSGGDDNGVKVNDSSDESNNNDDESNDSDDNKDSVNDRNNAGHRYYLRKRVTEKHVSFDKYLCARKKK
ncbi:uncharacterized protein DDB_G0290685 [Microplitis demolitor]|uniref:uncharacterized protein DDB_G0290685 n=1 Tax=Microplitis demolitor TaxID=69319 RepID=UPI0006D4DC96|nr:uncharacterized protein DDB_G0290685 [Microplitis demolitor]